MMAHKWQYDAWDAVVKSATNTICRLHGIDGEDFTDPITTKKNGRLIAAAPDLLAACKAAFDAMDAYMSLVPTISQADQELYEMLREAIAKAEGTDGRNNEKASSDV